MSVSFYESDTINNWEICFLSAVYIDTLRIRTAVVSQPFLDPSSLQNS